MGAELKNPGKTIPRSIVFSILGMMAIYLTLQIGVLGALPWQQIASSDSIGSLVLEHTWGKTAALIFTALIVITAFASVAMGLLGGSRVPFNAAKDGLFFPVFAKLHPRLNFPHIALIVMAVIMAIGSMFSLGDVINSLTAVMVLVQALAQIAALTVLRKRQPALKRPYKMTLYPLPSFLALFGWLYIYINAGRRPIELSLAWLALGILAFLIWARVEKTWPFGPKIIREEFNLA
jgi:amino acid transporter